MSKIKTETPVKVTLRIESMIDGQFERFNFVEDGRLVTLNDHQHYLTYTEHHEGVATPVRIRLDESDFSVTRNAARRTRLQFNPAEPTVSHYQTEYGRLALTVITERLNHALDLDAGQGRVELRYQIRNGEMLIGNYYLDLRLAK